jgi:hypothetical protein
LDPCIILNVAIPVVMKNVVLLRLCSLVTESFRYACQDALRTFLLRRLDNLTKDDKMQITMISTWATELYLDKVPSTAIFHLRKIIYNLLHYYFLPSHFSLHSV